MYGEIKLRGLHSQMDFASEITGVVARSVHLLDAIEETVNSLDGHTEMLQLLVEQGRRVLSALGQSQDVVAKGLIDPDNVISGKLKASAEKIHTDYLAAIAARESARLDPELRPDDGVEQAYTEHIAALADLHNVIEDLRDTMETIDARHSPTIGSFDNVDDLFSALDAD